jgi:hypothetical protein
MTDQTATFLSRRNLLAALGLGGAAAAAAVVASPPMPLTWTRRAASGSWWESDTLALSRGAMEDWQGQIGTSFSVKAESGSATLKLVEVQPLGSKGPRPAGLGRDRAFAAVFETSEASLASTDGIYTMEHETHGELAVFVTAGPQTGAAAATRLEAVFN